MTEIPEHELRAAASSVWLVLSLAVGLLLISSRALSEDWIFQHAPVCEAKARFGRECALCGMTHAFLDISRGKWREAERQNRASLPLYGIFLANEMAFLLAVVSGRWTVSGCLGGDTFSC
jgi:hypothetical protein